jgi:hypothetical protein
MKAQKFAHWLTNGFRSPPLHREILLKGLKKEVEAVVSHCQLNLLLGAVERALDPYTMALSSDLVSQLSATDRKVIDDVLDTLQKGCSALQYVRMELY